MKAMFWTALASAAIGSSAFGAVFNWNYNGVSPSQNPGGGQISNIDASFNNVTDAFTWDVTYSNGVTKDTDGYWLVVSNGPVPRGTADQFAIIYFDASNLAAPKVSVYRYSGQNNGLSWQNPANLLASSQVAGSGISATATQTGGQRRFQLSLDATAINAAFPAPAWEGIEFGNSIGVWFHSVGGLSTGYHSTSKKLNKFDYTREGWLDLDNQTTIPTPGAAAMMALAGLVAARRRRN